MVDKKKQKQCEAYIKFEMRGPSKRIGRIRALHLQLVEEEGEDG